jgi:hypothetical protein
MRKSGTGDLVTSSWRHRLRFSVRGLMLLVLIFGALLAWIVYLAQVQRATVASIRRADGLVRYHWEYHNGAFVRNGKPWWPQWLIRLVGIDYFGHATFVFATRATDADLINIVKLGRLERLVVPGTSVTDAGMARLQGLNYLESLIIFNTQIGDSGLAHLTTRPTSECSI